MGRPPEEQADPRQGLEEEPQRLLHARRGQRTSLSLSLWAPGSGLWALDSGLWALVSSVK